MYQLSKGRQYSKKRFLDFEVIRIRFSFDPDRIFNYFLVYLPHLKKKEGVIIVISRLLCEFNNHIKMLGYEPSLCIFNVNKYETI